MFLRHTQQVSQVGLIGYLSLVYPGKRLHPPTYLSLVSTTEELLQNMSFMNLFIYFIIFLWNIYNHQY